MQRLRQLSGDVFQVSPDDAAGRTRLGNDTGWKLLSDAVGRIAKLQHEMETAAAIQRALLPTTHRAGPFFDAAATTLPCRSIGGDFFDYMDLPGGALGFALGDVAGKGPPVARRTPPHLCLPRGMVPQYTVTERDLEHGRATIGKTGPSNLLHGTAD